MDDWGLSPGRARFFLFATASKPTVVLTHSHIKLVSEALFLGVKREGSEDGNLLYLMQRLRMRNNVTFSYFYLFPLFLCFQILPHSPISIIFPFYSTLYNLCIWRSDNKQTKNNLLCGSWSRLVLSRDPLTNRLPNCLLFNKKGAPSYECLPRGNISWKPI
jgi:hypothetical protein